MAEAISNHEVLHNILGGLQPGGTCIAWISGLVTCEALRLTQRFGDNTSWIRLLFVYVVLFLSVALARFPVGCRGILLCSRTIKLPSEKSNSLIASGPRYHFVCSRIVSRMTNWSLCFELHTDAECNVVIVSLDCGSVRQHSQIPDGADEAIQNTNYPNNYGMVEFRALLPLHFQSHSTIQAIHLRDVCAQLDVGETIHDYTVCHLNRSFRPLIIFPDANPRKKLVCGAVVTLIKAYDLFQSDAISKVLVMKGDPFRCAWGVLCLLCQTAIFPTVVDVILVCLLSQDGKVGAICSICSLSAEFHLFGPIMAISAALDEDPAECSTPCPVVKGSLNVGDARRKQITFEAVEQKVSN
ncbi:hypothetical protein VP01_1982g1 [Puccinia sorghi]|uniref:Uncharacterized protein n=1 Tax=Puccinia sorghi TaxID=27349 RepID=A0A0L6VBK2_9BASI|nr:hypothetical protein VP01_1982g1 [Puccinia sorghi]